MPSVELERTPAGYAVRCVFRTLPAAMRGVDGLLAVTEAAFESVQTISVPPCVALDERGAVIGELIDRAEQDDPPPHDGRTPVAYPVDEE